MTLQYNPKTNEYVVTSDDETYCKSVGLTLSTRVRGKNGEKVWFTDCPYAALPFYKQGDSKAKERLNRMWQDYDLSWASDVEADIPAPPGKAYMPFQKVPAYYSREHPNVLIGDAPGLGKTIQAIAISNEHELPLNLVVCPASIRLNWRREIEAWSWMGPEDSRPFPILKATSVPSIGVGHQQSPWVIVSYDMLRNPHLLELLCETEWDHLILDEAHYLKTPDAKRTRAVFGGGRSKGPNLAERSDRITALTGTPLPNRPRECFTLANALCPESIDWMSYDDFTYRFNPSGMIELSDERLINIEKKGRLPELQARLRSNFMIRRLKTDVLKDLPDKTYEFTYLEPDGRIREVLRHEHMLGFSIGDLIDPNAEIFGQISTIRREMGEAKVPRLIEHMKFLLDIVELPKVVFFLHHKSVMQACYDALERYRISVLRGGMSPQAKHASVTEFVSNKNKRIFMGQLDAAGLGIDGLQRVASHAVVGEPAWTPSTNEQAIDRLHRHGQHGNVIAQFAIVEGSLDEKVLKSVLDKTKTIHSALDSG